MKVAIDILAEEVSNDVYVRIRRYWTEIKHLNDPAWHMGIKKNRHYLSADFVTNV